MKATAEQMKMIVEMANINQRIAKIDAQIQLIDDLDLEDSHTEELEELQAQFDALTTELTNFPRYLASDMAENETELHMINAAMAGNFSTAAVEFFGK